MHGIQPFQAEDSPIPYLFRSLTWVQFSSVMSSNRHLSIGWGGVVRVYTHMYIRGVETVSMSMDDTFRTINKIRWIGGSIATTTNTGRRKRKQKQRTTRKETRFENYPLRRTIWPKNLNIADAKNRTDSRPECWTQILLLYTCTLEIILFTLSAARRRRRAPPGSPVATKHWNRNDCGTRETDRDTWIIR